MGQHGSQAPLLSPEQQILMEEEVTTPPGGGGGSSSGASRRGASRASDYFAEVRPRDGGPDRQKGVGSPVDMLVDTVARMQLNLANLLRTGC